MCSFHLFCFSRGLRWEKFLNGSQHLVRSIVMFRPCRYLTQPRPWRPPREALATLVPVSWGHRASRLGRCTENALHYSKTMFLNVIQMIPTIVWIQMIYWAQSKILIQLKPWLNPNNGVGIGGGGGMQTMPPFHFVLSQSVCPSRLERGVIQPEPTGPLSPDCCKLQRTLIGPI